MSTTANRSILHGARGVTLIELLVAVLVLVIMILAFSAILSQGQQVVSTSQRIIRANAQAAAIAQVFRRDVAAITTDGFLRISTTSPALVFTAVGPFVSRNPPSGLTNVHANAAIICYRIGDDTSVIGTGGRGTLLCREVHLLTKPAGAVGVWNPRTSDVALMFISNIQQESTGCSPNSIIGKFFTTPKISSAPATLADVKKTWPILVTGCSNFSVSYRAARSSGWTRGTKLWKHEDVDSWPVALRLKFELNKTDFEVICPIVR